MLLFHKRRQAYAWPASRQRQAFSLAMVCSSQPPHILSCVLQDPAQRLCLTQVMSHPWVTAGGSLQPLQSSSLQQAGSMPAKRELASAFDGASGMNGSGLADAAAADGPAADVFAAADVRAAAGARQQPLAAVQGAQPGQQATQGAEGEGIDAEQEALLRGALEGLVTGDLQVQTFAVGEPLMRRGQPGGLQGLCHSSGEKGGGHMRDWLHLLKHSRMLPGRGLL